MAKKTAVEETTEREAIQEEAVEGESGEFKFETGFDVDEEYKVPPLVPNGSYSGFVTGVKFSPSDNALVWDITLKADQDVLMSDNKTPVNGNMMFFRNWFPRSGDETTRTKTGKMTKRQAKINMIQDFSRKMKINMNTPEAIMDGVGNAEWIGLEVIVVAEIREYEGRLSNQIKDMAAA